MNGMHRDLVWCEPVIAACGSARRSFEAVVAWTSQTIQTTPKDDRMIVTTLCAVAQLLPMGA